MFVLRISHIVGAICLLSFSSAGCSKWELLNSTIPSWGYKRISADYGSAPRQTLDVYRPGGAKKPAKVVIFIYGGGWTDGSKEYYRFVGEALTSRGFVTVIPDYRLYPSVTFPAFVNDAALAFRWVHDNVRNFGGDSARIYLLGHSAGAQIAALLTLDPKYLKSVGLDPSDIKATAALSGPYDFVPPDDKRAVFNMAPAQTRPTPDSDVTQFARADAPPMLIIHGMKDDVIDPGNSRELAARLRNAGANPTAIFYPDRAHVDVVLAFAWPLRWMAPVLDDTAHFFDRH